MPLSWNEIKSRALRFSKEWENVTEESAEFQSSLIEFLIELYDRYSNPLRVLGI